MKKNDALLGSGQWYFVELIEGEYSEKVILDEEEYNNFFKGLNDQAKYIKLGDNYYFWSRVQKFGPIKFQPGVLEKIKSLDQKTQDHVKKRIRTGINVTTLEKLRSEVAIFLN